VKGDNVMHDPDFTLSAGPTMAWPRVLAAQAKQVTYHYDPAFMERFRDTERKPREIFLPKRKPMNCLSIKVIMLREFQHS